MIAQAFRLKVNKYLDAKESPVYTVVQKATLFITKILRVFGVIEGACAFWGAGALVISGSLCIFSRRPFFWLMNQIRSSEKLEQKSTTLQISEPNFQQDEYSKVNK